MRKIFLIILTYSLLCSCSTTRTATSAVSSQSTNNTSQSVSSTVQQDITQQRHVDADTEIKTVVEIFDTSQPVDQATGTPPLKERIETSTKQLAKHVDNIHIKSTVADTTQTNVQATAVNQSQTASSLEREFATGVWFWIFAGIVLALALGILYKRFINR